MYTKSVGIHPGTFILTHQLSDEDDDGDDDDDDGDDVFARGCPIMNVTTPTTIDQCILYTRDDPQCICYH